MIKPTLRFILIVLNCCILIYLIDMLFFNYNNLYYTAVSESEPEVNIITTFKIAVFLFFLIPTIIWIVTKQKLWLMQPIILVLIIWHSKTDFMQKTLFYYSPASTYKEVQEYVNNIKKHNSAMRALIENIEANADKSAFTIQKDEQLKIVEGKFIRYKHLGFDNGKAEANILGTRIKEKNSQIEIVKIISSYSIPNKILSNVNDIRFISVSFQANRISMASISTNGLTYYYYPHGGAKRNTQSYTSGYFGGYYSFHKNYFYNDNWKFCVSLFP